MVNTSKATTINVQYRSTASKDIWSNDGNGVPSLIVVRYSDIKNAWSAETESRAFAMSTSWDNTQNVNVPSAGKYLVLSNYRIWLGSKSSGFVKARVTLDSTEVGKVKMITERMHPTSKSFINYGGEGGPRIMAGVRAAADNGRLWPPFVSELVATCHASQPQVWSAGSSRPSPRARSTSSTYRHLVVPTGWL